MTIEVIPCAPGAHIGELITLGFLRDNLPGDHVILTNYHLPYQSGTLEIDLAVINYYGVFLLEVKHWWGKIEADQLHWLQAGRRYPSPLNLMDKKAKCVKGALVAARRELSKVSVTGFVVLSKGDELLNIDDPHSDRVFPLDERLIRALTSRDHVFSSSSLPLKAMCRKLCKIAETLGLRDILHKNRDTTPLNHTRLPMVKNALVHRHVDPERHIVDHYHIVDELTLGQICHAFEAKHITIQAFEAEHTTIQGRRARIKRYHIPAIQSMEHLKETVRQFKQDMEALSKAEGHPNIVHAYDFFKDQDADDTYYLVTEFISGRMLREVIDEDPAFSLAQGLHYLVPVADALAYCHKQGIIHRNLTPYSIYITDDGQIKLGDFDFAKVPAIGETITKTGQVLVENKYTAPEQIREPRHVDARADLYSLGAVWYDLIFRRPEDEPILLLLVANSGLSDGAKQLLLCLLSQQPANRPASAEEVKARFELLAEKE
jgi:tRNA A-37 threonylcarbamoyl transferase component Bud32